MTVRISPLTCSAAIIVVALIAAPIAFAPTLGGSGSASAQTTVDKAGNTHTTVPDNTFGPGGSKESVSGRDYRLAKEAVRDSTGRVRENADFGPGGETRSFFDAQGRAVGVINVLQVNGTWQMSVIGFSPYDQRLDSKNGATKEALEQDAAYWQRQLRFWATGNVGPVPAADTPGYGLADPGSLPPGTGYAIGPRAPQPGGLTIQCFGDIACERAQAQARGEPFDFGGKRDDKGRERDDRKDRPLYERPDLPSNRLPYEPGLPDFGDKARPD